MQRIHRLLWIFLLLNIFCASLAAAEPANKRGKPININTATVEELAELPGVGKEIARRIVRHREKSGKFRRVEELLVIRGISRKKLDALRPLVTVETQESEKDLAERKGSLSAAVTAPAVRAPSSPG